MHQTSTESLIWEERVRVRSFDVDGTRRAKVERLCAYFVEVAWAHAEALGFGFSHLQAQGKFWVLSRLRVEMTAYPVWGDEIVLRTWPRAFEGPFAFRDFEILNAAGVRLGAGTSSWLVLDLISKRPQRLNKLLPGRETMPTRAALGRDAAKLEGNEVWDSEGQVVARHSDIDANRHVTASRYVGWVVDSYPVGFHERNAVRVLEVNYLNETVEGERVLVRTRRAEENAYLHSLVKVDGEEVCRVRVEWVVSHG